MVRCNFVQITTGMTCDAPQTEPTRLHFHSPVGDSCYSPTLPPFAFLFPRWSLIPPPTLPDAAAGLDLGAARIRLTLDPGRNTRGGFKEGRGPGGSVFNPTADNDELFYPAVGFRPGCHRKVTSTQIRCSR